jgi:hypothetical protein
VLLDGNPLDDISNTRRIETVFVNGRLHRVVWCYLGSPLAPTSAEATGLSVPQRRV